MSSTVKRSPWLALPLLLGAASTAGAAEQTTRVDISSELPVSLERFEGGRWLRACDAPCGRQLPVADVYRLAGRSVLLPADRPSVVLTVTTSWPPVRVAGAVMIGVGAPATVVGLMTALLGQLQGVDGDCGHPCKADLGLGGRLTAGGLTAAAVGAALAIAGAVMVTRPGEATVTMSRGAPFVWRF
jgi:hypothetical protein